MSRLPWPPLAWPLLWRSGLGIIAALALALGAAALLLRPPVEDMWLLAASLTASGLASLAAGAVVARLAWRRRWGGLHRRIGLAIALGILVALANVAATAALMFLSPHDLGLLALLLGFALVLSLVFGGALARALTADLRRLTTGAQRMAGGDLSARVDVATGDEVGDLAQAFNTMAAAVEAAFAREREAERARRDLMAAVSHDLRTPLTTLRVMAEALHDDVVSEPDTVRRYLATMQGDIQRLNALIDDLFELSRLDAGVLELARQPVAIGELVVETVAGLQVRATRQGVCLDCELDETAAPVEVDPPRVQRVLANLVQNALQHTAAGGRVTVATHQHGDTVEVAVADTGEGIAAHALPHVFERFYRADPARRRDQGGAGLGLAIARGLVEAHGGRIWAESTAGEGATFRFTLPMVAPARSSELPLGRTRAEVSRQ